MKIYVNSQTIAVGATKILKSILSHRAKKGATIVYCIGSLGAGKTTLIQYFGKLLGIKQKMPSPTFPILKRYAVRNNFFNELVHIDAYRIEGKNETIIEYIKEKSLNDHTLMFVEWPTYLPKKTLVSHATIRIGFNNKNSDTRTIVYANKNTKRKKTSTKKV